MSSFKLNPNPVLECFKYRPMYDISNYETFMSEAHLNNNKNNTNNINHNSNTSWNIVLTDSILHEFRLSLPVDLCHQ